MQFWLLTSRCWSEMNWAPISSQPSYNCILTIKLHSCWWWEIVGKPGTIIASVHSRRPLTSAFTPTCVFEGRRKRCSLCCWLSGVCLLSVLFKNQPQLERIHPSVSSQTHSWKLCFTHSKLRTENVMFRNDNLIESKMWIWVLFMTSSLCPQWSCTSSTCASQIFTAISSLLVNIWN